MRNWTKLFLNSAAFGLLLAARLWAVPASGGNYNLTKALSGESGVNEVSSADYGSPYSLGEDAAGVESQSSDYDLVSGYFSGYPSGTVGPFRLLSTYVGPNKILQNGLQVGVPLNTSAQLIFSSPLDPTTLTAGVQVMMVMDHLGQAQDSVVPSSYTYDVTGSTLIISPQGAWPGNSLLDVVVNSQLISLDGFALAQEAHTPFVTVLDPQQENIVLQPIPIPGVAAAPAASGQSSLNLDIPTESLSDYAYVLVSQDPLHSPLQADPKILEAATQKAENSGGAYETPLALAEIAAYNEHGQAMSLTKPITISIGGNDSGGMGGTPVRAQTYSLWSLDAADSLWVKMPDSRPNGTGVSGQVSQFNVYALMGSAEGDASSVFVFPNPWRPHGRDAGNGAGQTGTDTTGMTFNNLPSECSIKIYTLAGNLVRQLQHSDLAGPVGQEKWDGNTTSGDHAASGVYLWRVESSADSKNGKLLVIR